MAERRFLGSIAGGLPGLLMVAIAMLLASCAEREVLLPGERFELRDLEGASETRDAPATESAIGSEALGATPEPVYVIPIPEFVVTGEPQRISIPAQRANADWTHINGGPTHQITNPALGNSLTRVWSASIGNGNTRKLRLNSAPVVAGGRVFTIDTLAEVRAHSTNGQLLWARQLTPPGEKPGETSGGGVSVGGNRVFVNTGWGRVHALDATSGRVIWTQRLGSVPSGSPTVSNGLVYLTTRDGRAWALDADDGRISWELTTSSETSFTVTGGSPAVTSRSTIFPFGSGELVAVLRRGGLQLWATSISGERRGRAYASISDLASDPVIVGNTVYAGSNGGRLVAVNATSGERIWTALEGANSPVWPVGGSLFLISDENRLLRINASTGQTIWSATLPLFTKEKIRRQKAVFAHYGPILAGSRLILVSNDGILRQVDPASGQLIGAVELPAPAAADPVVAGRTLYVVTADGNLHAFR